MGPSVFVCSSALEHNLRHLLNVAQNNLGTRGPAVAFPVIKANAYGHDAAQVASFLAQKFTKDSLPIFCVARSAELGPLLALNSDRDFLVLSQMDWDWHLQHASTPHVIWTLASFDDLELWQQKGSRIPELSRVHLKINSGMNRLGLSLNQFESILPLLKKCVQQGLKIEGIFTHFWNSDAKTSEDSLQQLDVFAKAIELLNAHGMLNDKTWIHAENSASLRWRLPLPERGRVAFRPGIHLWGYGLDRDYEEHDETCAKLQSAFAVGAPVRQMRTLSLGEGLSYGWKFKSSQDQTYVASVPLGYADGIPRSLSWDGQGKPRGFLVIEGKSCPIISTVTMDMVMVAVDLSTFQKFHNKQNVFAYWIHPEHQSVSLVASRLHTITYEVLCMISTRLPRLMRDSFEDLP